MFIVFSKFFEAGDSTSFDFLVIISKELFLFFKWGIESIHETNTFVLNTTLKALFFSIKILSAHLVVICILNCFEITSIHVLTNRFLYFECIFFLLIKVLALYICLHVSKIFFIVFHDLFFFMHIIILQ